MQSLNLRQRRLWIRKKTGDKSVELGDQVLVKQTKSPNKPPFNPSPYKVMEVSGNSATLERDGRRIKGASTNQRP